MRRGLTSRTIYAQKYGFLPDMRAAVLDMRSGGLFVRLNGKQDHRCGGTHCIIMFSSPDHNPYHLWVFVQIRTQYNIIAIIVVMQSQRVHRYMYNTSAARLLPSSRWPLHAGLPAFFSILTLLMPWIQTKNRDTCAHVGTRFLHKPVIQLIRGSVNSTVSEVRCFKLSSSIH